MGSQKARQERKHNWSQTERDTLEGLQEDELLEDVSPSLPTTYMPDQCFLKKNKNKNQILVIDII